MFCLAYTGLISNSLSLPPFLALEAMGENAKTDLILNMFHHSDSGRLLICYTDYFYENKQVEMVSVAISVWLYHIMPGLLVFKAIIRTDVYYNRK
jgi:hypothetical protein